MVSTQIVEFEKKLKNLLPSPSELSGSLDDLSNKAVVDICKVLDKVNTRFLLTLLPDSVTAKKILAARNAGVRDEMVRLVVDGIVSSKK